MRPAAPSAPPEIAPRPWGQISMLSLAQGVRQVEKRDRTPARRERLWASAIVVALVVARSAIFVFWDQSYFDSDQAVFGLMGKHLSEGRALPIFMYGQNYILAVEAW